MPNVKTFGPVVQEKKIFKTFCYINNLCLLRPWSDLHDPRECGVFAYIVTYLKSAISL